MKKAFIIGLSLLTIGSVASFAQSGKAYEDDVYYNSKTAKTEAQQEEQQPAETRSPNSDESTYSSSSGDSYERKYNDEGQYNDADDDYYYSSRINRFYYPFYDRPYWSSFYNPFSYDPYWVDPYWGYNPWARPGFSISIGVGPYWSSYYGWSAWYGYSPFGSYYGYPAYGLGGGYYSGYWNGYYAGLYNNYYGGRSGYRAITYGPRYSLSSNSSHAPSQFGGYRGLHREARGNNMQQQQGASTFGNATNMRQGSFGTAAERPDRGAVLRNGDRNNVVAPESAGRPSRGFFGNRDDAARSSEAGRVRANDAASQQQQTPQPERSRNGWFGGGRGDAAPARAEQPRFTPAPRMEVPQRSFGGGERSGSFGGGRPAGGGGGSFGGGHSGGGGGGHRGR